MWERTNREMRGRRMEERILEAADGELYIGEIWL